MLESKAICLCSGSLTGAAQKTCTAGSRKVSTGRKRRKLVWPSRLLHIAISPHACATARHILAHHRVVVGMGPGLQGLLGDLIVLLLAQPGDDAGLLERLAVREGEVPRHLGLGQLVHGAEVDRCHLLIVLVQWRLAREEEDAWERRGDRA